jgi:hypothetical protein
MDQAKLARMQASVRIGMLSPVALGLLAVPEKTVWSLKDNGLANTSEQGKQTSSSNFGNPAQHHRKPSKSPNAHDKCDIGEFGGHWTWSTRLIGRYSGKGTPRRKVKKVHRAAGTDDKKLQAALKKLNVQPIQAIEEVNMFKSDGNVIHFSAPKGGSRHPVHEMAFGELCQASCAKHYLRSAHWSLPVDPRQLNTRVQLLTRLYSSRLGTRQHLRHLRRR